MNKPLYVYKPQGFTPFEIIQELKKRPEYEHETISYAGRLDPMAEGVLVLLVGEDNKNRKAFEDMRKTYSVEILLGVQTDTYDALGIITKPPQATLVDEEMMCSTLDLFKGKFSQEYPPYSSKTVSGKPLYYWSRNNKLSEITIPKRVVEIFSITLNSKKTITATALAKRVFKEISVVSGDFRQDAILQEWKRNLEGKDVSFQIFQITVECSSGTYMRTLAYTIGKKLSASAIALHITREKVGDVSLTDCLYL